MIETQAQQNARIAAQLNGLRAAHAEWLCSRDAQNIRALTRDDWELTSESARLYFHLRGDGGAWEAWRVAAWEQSADDKLTLQLTRRLQRAQARVELIPRGRFAAQLEFINATRSALCEHAAQLALAHAGKLRSKIIRAALSRSARRNELGTTARIIIERGRERLAVVAPVVTDAVMRSDALLTGALLWFAQLRAARIRPPLFTELWLLVEPALLDALQRRVMLLREDLRVAIKLFERDSEWSRLTEHAPQTLEEIIADEPVLARGVWRAKLPGAAAQAIVRLAPEAMDIVRAGHGETLRYHGLPFARIRRVTDGNEEVWFGIDVRRRLRLTPATRREWEALLARLVTQRTPENANRLHNLYRAAPEAWLETLLRRNINLLDPGLRLAPLFAQFRTPQPPPRTGKKETTDETDAGKPSAISQTKKSLSVRPIDLLALRYDGRLAVIELKVAPDRSHVMQAAEYWLRVEAQRRRGYIARARLFGAAEIADEPPLVYLVAPTLSFHRATVALAEMLRPEIQVYRYDLNEDWRARVRVARRLRLAAR